MQPTTIKAPFLEQFTPDWESRWTVSSATKEQQGGEVFSYVGKWSVEEPSVFPGLAGDNGLVAKSKAAQHAISAQFPEVIDPKAAALDGKPLVIQYEVKLQNGLSCGGAYMKLLTEGAEGIQAKEFSDKTPYTIMFGPDKVSHKSVKRGTRLTIFILSCSAAVPTRSTSSSDTRIQYPGRLKKSTCSTLLMPRLQRCLHFTL